MSEAFGNKVKGLVGLEASGARVPRFLAFNARTSEASVQEKVRRFFPPGTLLSVRSSASIEDGEHKSHAGAFVSKIAVSQEELPNAWRAVRSSLPDPSTDGIIIQAFIRGSFSGVIFADAANNRALISYLPGLCKAVVEGYDSIEVEFDGRQLVRRHVPDHVLGMFTDPENHTIVEHQSDELLTEGDLLELSQQAVNLSKKFGKPLDMEWTYAEGVLHWLQARHITADPWGSNRIHIYDSANVGESYSGLVAPLTLTFAKRLYSQVYQDLLQHSGVRPATLIKHQHIFDSLVEGCYGRMYYRMDHWYRFMRMLPGYSRNKQNLEHMLMLTSEELDAEDISPSFRMRLLYYPLVIWKLIHFGKKMRRFDQEVRSLLSDSGGWKVHSMETEEVLATLDELLSGILRKWYLTVENDTVVMSLLSFFRNNPSRYAEELVYAFHSVSADQVKALVQLSRKIMADETLATAIESGDLSVWETALEHKSELKQEYDRYKADYGARFANELKLETPDMMEDFASFSRLIKLYKNHEVVFATQKAEKAPYLVRVFHRFASRREVFRLHRANMFGLIRSLVVRLGSLMADKGLLDDSRDVFYLDWEDLFSQSDPSTFPAKIAQNKSLHGYYATLKPPSAFTVKDGRWPKMETGNVGSDELIGQGVSAGVGIGHAEVMREFGVPSSDGLGVLVTERTDPGWTALMAISKGLVVEHGGMLSHASIVARELNIPAVIGVKDACDRIKTGEQIAVDGTTGLVKRMKSA